MAKKRICPSCGEADGLRRYIYGLLAEPLDETKYVTGGCVTTGFDPDYACLICNWSGSFNRDGSEKQAEPWGN